MTNKELQKLGRRELLQLLLDQAKEADRLGKLLKANDEQLKQLEEGYERLRDRLDKKDAQIHQLKDELQAERDKREAETALRFNGGFDPAQQMAEQYLRRAQGRYPASAGAAAPGPEAGAARPGFQAQPSYQAQDPYGGPYQAQTPDPFPYQVPSQSQEPYPCQAPAPDPFPYQVPYREGAAPESYPAGMEAQQYQYPPLRPERRRQSGQHGKMPFRLKKDQENGKTTLFFGWQHN